MDRKNFTSQAKPEPSEGTARRYESVTLLIGAMAGETVVIGADSRTTAAFTCRDNRRKVRAFPRGDLVVGCADDDEVADELFSAAQHVQSPPTDPVGFLVSEIVLARRRVAAGPGSGWRPIQTVAAALLDGKPTLLRCFQSEGWSPTSDRLCWSGPPGLDATRMLSSYWRPDMSPREIVRLIVATIGATARLNPAVGGKVQIGVLDRDGARLLEDEVGEAAAEWATTSEDLEARLGAYIAG
ncbi:MAG: hypothetical protein ACYCTE_10640 [Acidimicrobiales bacterium]